MTIPAGYGQVTFLFTGGGVPTGAACVFGVNPDGVISTAELLAAAAEDAWDRSDMASLYDQSVNMSSIHAKLGPDSTGAAADLSTNYPGARTGAVGYPGVALLVRKNSALGGRRGQGRFFLPGICEEDIEIGGQTTALFRSLVATNIQFLFETFAENLIPHVILHNNDDEPTLVTGLAPQAQVATQRRRNRR